jgi:hypothetical protein
LLIEGRDTAAKEFYSLLSEDCDLKGTSWSEFFRQRFIQALVCGSSFMVVDFPRDGAQARTKAEEDALGRSRAYLTDYSAEEIVNWSYNPSGGMDWVVIRTSCLRQASLNDPAPRRETQWIYYDRENFQLFRRTGDGERVEPVDAGRHGLAGFRQVPVFELKISEGLWLMNKAALLQLEHFNKSNALAWALTMGLFAMPVVYSDKEWKQLVGESYYIQLGKEDRFGWTEPEGKVYQIAADNLAQLKDEIYRVCYLTSQAAGGSSGGAQQSALGKQLDFRTTEEVLKAYGDAMKGTMRRVLWAMAAARQDDVSISVTGLDEFDIEDLGMEIGNAAKLLELGVGSKTLKKEIFKKLALQYLCDARQEVKTRVAEEIERGEA